MSVESAGGENRSLHLLSFKHLQLVITKARILPPSDKSPGDKLPLAPNPRGDNWGQKGGRGRCGLSGNGQCKF